MMLGVESQMTLEEGQDMTWTRYSGCKEFFERGVLRVHDRNVLDVIQTTVSFSTCNVLLCSLPFSF